MAEAQAAAYVPHQSLIANMHKRTSSCARRAEDGPAAEPACSRLRRRRNDYERVNKASPRCSQWAKKKRINFISVSLILSLGLSGLLVQKCTLSKGQWFRSRVEAAAVIAAAAAAATSVAEAATAEPQTAYYTNH